MSLRKYWHSILLFSLWFFATLPLFGSRFIPTHDGEYHLIRIYEFFRMLSLGHLFPRWAPDLNSGFGFPLFNFHYPFPNYIGSVLHFFGFPLVQSFQIGMALGFGLAIIGCYLFLRKMFSSRATLVGTVLFMTVPYWFVDIYVRGSIGEVWALGFIMCALAAIVHKKKLLLACAVCLLILSHNILGLMGTGFLFLYTFISDKKLLIYLFLGIGGAAYFWIPALAETKYVVGLNSVTYSDHFPTVFQLLFPSWGTNFSQPGLVVNEMSQQIGILPIFIIILSTFLRLRKKEKRKDLLYLIVVVGTAIFFMLSFSQPIWNLIPPLQYLQYPWRLLSFVIIAVPFLGAWSVEHMTPRISGGLAVVALLLVYSYTRPVTYEPRNDRYYLSRKEFTDGTSSLGNSLSTIWTPWISARASGPITVLSGNVEITPTTITPTDLSFDVQSASPAVVRINRTYYPGWQVRLNHLTRDGSLGNGANRLMIPIDYMKNGTVDITIPEGKFLIQAQFTETPLRKIADVLSLGCLLVAVVVRYSETHAYRI